MFSSSKGKFVLDDKGQKIPSIFSKEVALLKEKGYKFLSDGTVTK